MSRLSPAALCWLLAGAAHADDQRLAILPAVVQGEHGQADAAALFRPALVLARYRLGVRALSYNEVFVDGEVALATQVRDCGSDLQCVAQALRVARVELGLQIIANFAVAPPLVTVGLVSAADGRAISESLAELRAGAPLDAALRKAVGEALDRAGLAAGARLSLELSPADAVLRVGAAGKVELGRELILEPGVQLVRAEREGYEPGSTQVELVAGEERKVRLTLAPRTAGEEGGILSSPWFWVAAAAVAVGTAAAVVVAAEPFKQEPTRACLCITTAAGGCEPCP